MRDDAASIRGQTLAMADDLARVAFVFRCDEPPPPVRPKAPEPRTYTSRDMGVFEVYTDGRIGPDRVRLRLADRPDDDSRGGDSRGGDSRRGDGHGGDPGRVRLATPDGDRAIRTIRVGDAVTVIGGIGRVRWVGVARTRLAAANWADVAPVLIRRGALGPMRPARDLPLTRRHGVLIDHALVPAEHLVNGTSIVWLRDRGALDFHHIELDSHAVLFAEGAAVESFRDDSAARLFASLAERQAPCRPIVERGAELEAIWSALAGREARITSDPDLHLDIDGARLDGTRQDDTWTFAVPDAGPNAGRDAGSHLGPGAVFSGTRLIAIASRSDVPAALGVGLDVRRLGVAVRHIRLRGTFGTIDLPANDPTLTAGFHPAEGDWRWTNGFALLPDGLLDRIGRGVSVTVSLANVASYRC